MTPPAGATRRPISAHHVHSLSRKTPKEDPKPHQPELHLVRTGRDRYEVESSGAAQGRHLSLPMARYTTGFRSANERQRRSLAANPGQLSISRGIKPPKAASTPPTAVAAAPKAPAKATAQALKPTPAPRPKVASVKPAATPVKPAVTKRVDSAALAALDRQSRAAQKALGTGSKTTVAPKKTNTGDLSKFAKREAGDGVRLRQSSSGGAVATPGSRSLGHVASIPSIALGPSIGPTEGPSTGQEVKVDGIRVKSGPADGPGERIHSADLSHGAADKVEIHFGVGIPRGTRGYVRNTFFKFSVSQADLKDPAKAGEIKGRMTRMMELALERDERLPRDASVEAVAQLGRVVDSHLEKAKHQSIA